MAEEAVPGITQGWLLLFYLWTSLVLFISTL